MATGNSTSIDELRDRLGPWLERHARPAWRPVVSDEAPLPSVDSKFGGLPWLKTGEDWPSCTTCGRPLQVFLQLDLDRLPPELGRRFGSGLLQVFYCVEGDCAANGWEAFSSGKIVRVVFPAEEPGAERSIADAAREPFATRWVTGWRAVIDHPHPPEHEELGLGYAFDFGRGVVRVDCPELGVSADGLPTSAPEELSTAIPGDKLAGWPLWVQGVEYPTCPRCGRVMQLVFQIESEDNVPFMLGDVGTGHVTQCPVHTDTVTFAWACS
jgi:uncharacterized protein YwqG